MTFFKLLSQNPRHTEENHEDSQDSPSPGRELKKGLQEYKEGDSPTQYRDSESERNLLFFIIVDIYST
jgi:hypothetical protein